VDLLLVSGFNKLRFDPQISLMTQMKKACRGSSPDLMQGNCWAAWQLKNQRESAKSAVLLLV
jgi:hypothetical protein